MRVRQGAVKLSHFFVSLPFPYSNRSRAAWRDANGMDGLGAEGAAPASEFRDYVAEDLALRVPPVLDREPCQAVVELLTRNAELPGVAVVDQQGRVLGLISRTEFMTALAKPYARDLYGRRPITSLMDPQPLIVEAHDPITVIGQRIVDEHPAALEQGFVIVRAGRYVGLGTAVEFLRYQVDLAQARSRQLEVARQQAEQANQAKSSFLANMSHEIRTPLNSVVANLEMLRLGNLAPQERDMVEAADMAAGALMQILGDILDFSKIEAGRLDIEQIDFSPRLLVREVITLLHSRADQAGISLRAIVAPEVPDQLLGDPHRLRQILINLVANALKFTTQGGVWLYVTVIGVGRQHVTLRYEVSDTGVGFAPERGPSLFDAFTQADRSTTRKFGGSGLGLAICRKLAELMGGTIANDGYPGGGASFYCDLPHPVLALAPPTDRALFETQRFAILTPDAGLASRIEAMVTANLAQGIVAHTAADGVALLRDAACLKGAIVDLRLLAGADPIGQDLRARLLELECLLVLSPVPLDFAQRRRLLTMGLDRVLAPPFSARPVLGWLGEALGSDIRLPSRNPDAALEGRFAGRADDIGILVLEDVPMNQAVVRRQFSLLGLPVTLAANGRQGLELLASRPWKMIFTDIHMPELDGYGFTRAVRAQEQANRRPAIPIIAMTANALEGDARECLAAGMDDYLAKPVTLGRLAAILEKWLPGIAPDPTPSAVAAPPIGRMDIEAFYALVGSRSPAIAQDLLGCFVDVQADLLVKLAEAVTELDREAIHNLAHAAKGAALSAAANDLAGLLQVMEKQVATLTEDQIHDHMIVIEQCWRQTRDYIEAFLATLLSA